MNKRRTLVVIAITYHSNLYGYIDMGTGSLLMQWIVGLFFGGIFLIKTNWSRLKSWFKKRFTK